MMDGTESRIHCIAIDDEPLALDVVSKFCERHGSISLTVYSNPEEGIAAIKETHPDLVFLDIEMENMTGLTIAAQIDRDICVIFTTAYLNYALEGFNPDAVDYLHKPFSFTRFQTAIEKAVRRIEYNRTALASNSITVKQEYSNVNIPFSDIIYIEAMEGYSKIFRRNGVCTVSRIILKNLCALLPEKYFIRVHRSYVVALSKISSYSKQEVRLLGDISIPVGRQYSDAISERFNSR